MGFHNPYSVEHYSEPPPGLPLLNFRLVKQDPRRGSFYSVDRDADHDLGGGYLFEEAPREPAPFSTFRLFVSGTGSRRICTPCFQLNWLGDTLPPDFCSVKHPSRQPGLGILRLSTHSLQSLRLLFHRNLLSYYSRPFTFRDPPLLHHSDFFAHFPGFVRKLASISSSNKWTTSSGSNTTSPTTATSSSTFRGLFANSLPSPATSGRLLRGRTSLLALQRLLLPLSGVCSQPHPHRPATTRIAELPPIWLSTTLQTRRPPSPSLSVSTPALFPPALAGMVTGTGPSLVAKTGLPGSRPGRR